MPAAAAVRLHHIDPHEDAVMLQRGFKDRLVMARIDKRARGGERSGKIRLRLDHHAIREKGAGKGAYLMPGCEPGLGALVLLSQLSAMDRQPQTLGALLEGS
jgi:hypothetical protein